MAASPGGTGWPFLVAPGRVRDHTVVVAPGPLVESGEYGALEMVAVPGSTSMSWEQTSIRRRDGRALAVAYRTRAITPDDVTSPGTDTPSAPIRDEHNRPLLAVVGIVTAQPLAGDLRADLDGAWETVRPAYRTFLDDELGFVVAGSTLIQLASRAQTPDVAEPVLRAKGTDPALEDRPRMPAARVILLSISVILVAVVTAMAIALHPWNPSPVKPAHTPIVTVTTPPLTPAPTPTPTPRTGQPDR